MYIAHANISASQRVVRGTHCIRRFIKADDVILYAQNTGTDSFLHCVHLPEKLSTTATVLSRIRASSASDQLSIYARSMRTTSSKSSI